MSIAQATHAAPPPTTRASVRATIQRAVLEGTVCRYDAANLADTGPTRGRGIRSWAAPSNHNGCQTHSEPDYGQPNAFEPNTLDSLIPSQRPASSSDHFDNADQHGNEVQPPWPQDAAFWRIAEDHDVSHLRSCAPTAWPRSDDPQLPGAKAFFALAKKAENERGPQGRANGGEPAYRRDSVRSSRPCVTIHLCNLPGSVYGRTALSLLGLAPDGVYLATPVARRAGALLPHRFTLACAPKGHRRSVLCGTVLRVTPTGR